MMWWGYLHSNGSVQLKPWHGDKANYTTDCEDSPLVVRVVEPFEADADGDQAMRILRGRLGVHE